MSGSESRAGRSGAGLTWAVRARAVGAGFAFGLLSGLSFPPIGLWFFAFLAPVPVIVLSLRHPARVRRAGFWSAVGVMPWWGLAHVWAIDVSPIGYAPMTMILALYTWLAVWVIGRAAHRFGLRAAAVMSPVVYVGLEFLRGTVAFDGYAFFLLAHPLIDSPDAVMAAPAAWFGAYFVSGLVAVVAAAIAWVIVARRWLGPGLAIAGVSAVFAVAGLTRAPIEEDAQRVRFAVVQTNVPQDNRAAWTLRQRVQDWLEMRELVLGAAEFAPDVIVMPEGMFPGRVLGAEGLAAERAAELIWPMAPDFEGDAPGLIEVPDYLPATELADNLVALQGEVGVPIVVGGSGYDALRVEEEDGGLRYAYDAIYNSVYVVEGGRAPERRYDKMHLAPFGEVMPYISSWPWLERQLLTLGARGMTFSLESGNDPLVLEVPARDGPLSIATPICFEGTVPHVCRRLVFGDGGRRAGVLVNLTNDGWFGDWTPARAHHAMACRWRCVELATPMVRSANTGISGAYDARGRVIADRVSGSGAPDRVAGVVVAEVPVGTGDTLYARVGDIFGGLALIVVPPLILATFLRRRGPDLPGDASGAGRSADDGG